MSYKANVKFGAIPVQVDAEDLKGLIQQVSIFSEVPTECQCGSTNIVPRHRKHEDNDFYEIVCQDCKHTMGLGQHKVGKTLFVKNADGWREPFRKEQD